MSDALAIWQALMEPRMRALLEAAAVAPPDVAAVARLRRRWPAPLVHAALSLGAARRKAELKWPGDGAAILGDARGVEQATSRAVAEHKARRFLDVLEAEGGLSGGPAMSMKRGGLPGGASRPRPVVVDLCCGIGGDAMAMEAAGLKVLAVDRDPVRAWMTHRNARCPAAAADVGSIDLNGAPFHIDPSRRGLRDRRWRFDDYEPGPAVIEHLLARSHDAAVKLGPGVELDRVLEMPVLQRSAKDAASGVLAEIEMISEDGRLVQAVLWTGRLARSPRAATLIRRDGSPPLTLRGEVRAVPQQPLGSHVLVPDPAVERAGLLADLADTLGMGELHPGLGLLTGELRGPAPWGTAFECLSVVPWSAKGPARVKRWLAAHDGGVVEVKTRDGVVDPDVTQRQLRGGGSVRYTVFVLRFGRQRRALVTRRLRWDDASELGKG